MSPKIWLLIASIVGAILIILGAVLGFKVLPDYVHSEIEKQVYLENGTEQYDRWEKLPFPLTFKIHVFNILNPDEIMAGEKPIVEERGPYIYKQHRKKVDVTFYEEEDTYNYRQIQNYEFDEKASAPLTLDDEVVIFNSPKYGVIETLLETGGNVVYGRKALNKAFPDSTDSLFHKIKVRNYFFDGYQFCVDNKIGLCTIVRLAAKDIKTMETYNNHILFSFFRFKDDKDDGLYNISAGISDVMQTGQITSFDGADHLNIWGDPESVCNAVKGTDSSIFPPFNDKDTVHKVFSTDICRTVTLEFEKEVTFKGITGYRSVAKENTFDSPIDFEDNECFCINKTKNLDNKRTCFPSGFIDMNECLGSPVLVSRPHFLGADKSYADTVIGLNPNPDLHNIYIDLEPNTGTPLRGGKRVQFNMVLRPSNAFNLGLLKNVPKAIIPILWVEEGVELPDKFIDKLNEDLFSKLPMIEGLKWGMISIGIADIVICFFLFLCKYRHV